ncbi:thioredoxin domain-containing protein 6-like [Penaeus indicus]|uniref:thioredoxin domain-containing protein 6-like n=1 Tax=Penaeus indicus TaxID=29960 RepID=UPI00300DB8D3
MKRAHSMLIFLDSISTKCIPPRTAAQLEQMARKKAEAQQLQIIISNDQDWENACKRTGLLVVDVYQEWAGPCSSMTGHLRRIKLELGDEFLTLAMPNIAYYFAIDQAKADNISVLEKFRGKAEPTWLFLGCGKPLGVIHGADGPNLLSTIRLLLKKEISIIKGQGGERDVVLLESLVKPEEVLEPDEDLDDVEGEMQNLDSEEGSVAEEEPLQQAVLFILPHIISQEKTETFLSNVVAAGEGLVAEGRAMINSKEGGGEEGEEGGDEEGNEDDEKEKDGEVVEDDLEDWEEKLSHGPLYMLYLNLSDCVLERMGVSGVQVLAHTQLTLQQEAIQSLPSLSASQQLASAAGSSVLAVVVAGEGTEECVQEFGPLHLSSDTASANAEVELFFPDFLAAQDNQDEPQTQMQIEQRKEAK